MVVTVLCLLVELDSGPVRVRKKKMFWFPWFCHHKHSLKLSQRLVKNIQRCRAFRCWKAISNSDLCVGSCLARLSLCHHPAWRSAHTCILIVIWRLLWKCWYDMMTYIHLNISVDRRNVKMPSFVFYISLRLGCRNLKRGKTSAMINVVRSLAVALGVLPSHLVKCCWKTSKEKKKKTDSNCTDQTAARLLHCPFSVIVCEHRRLSWLYVDTKLNSVPLLFMQSVTWNGYTTRLLVLNLHLVVLVSGTWRVHVNLFVTSSPLTSDRTKLDLGQQIVLSLFLSCHRHPLLHLTWRSAHTHVIWHIL